MRVDLEKGFWLMRSVPGKQGSAWDKTLYLLEGHYAIPFPKTE
jgi:hypothetical protein